MTNKYFVSMLIDDCRAHLNQTIEMGIQGSYVCGVLTNVQEGVLTISDALVTTGEKTISRKSVTVDVFSVGWWCWYA